MIPYIIYILNIIYIRDIAWMAKNNSIYANEEENLAVF